MSFDCCLNCCYEFWVAFSPPFLNTLGENINDDDMRHLFDRFYKTDLSREKDRTGAGLGLSFVKNILRLHKQQVTVNSERDEATGHSTITFEFTLEME